MNRRQFLYAAGAGLAGIVLASGSLNIPRHNQQKDGFYWCDGKVVDTNGTLKERRLLKYIEDGEVIGHFGVFETYKPDSDDDNKIWCWDRTIEGIVNPEEFPEVLREKMPVLMKHYDSNDYSYKTNIRITEIHNGPDYKGLKFSFSDGSYEMFTLPTERHVQTTKKIKRTSFFQRLFSQLSSYLPHLDGIRVPI